MQILFNSASPRIKLCVLKTMDSAVLAKFKVKWKCTAIIILPQEICLNKYFAYTIYSI